MAARLTRDDILTILSTWQERLWLREWRIEVKWTDTGPDGCSAAVSRNPTCRIADLWLHPDWPTWSRAFANETIVHELVHCLHRDPDMALERHLGGGLLSGQAEALVMESYDLAMERFVDDISRILVTAFGEV